MEVPCGIISVEPGWYVSAQQSEEAEAGELSPLLGNVSALRRWPGSDGSRLPCRDGS